MIRDLLNYLELQVKQEGSQLVIDCPQCGKEKHCHVAPETGLWHCKVCSASGNPWRLVEIMMPNLDTSGICQMLKEHGLYNDNQNSTPSKQPNLKLTKNDIRPMTEDEITSVCSAKQISREALLKFAPYAHAREPLMLIPAFEPDNLSKACGWLRCRFDGAPIILGNGKSVKYPIVSGSVHGLFGLKTLTDEQPETIVFAEAWRDALAAISLGYAATASSGGASTWYDTWLPVFKDKTVYIVMDRDDAGVRAAVRAANAILDVAKSVNVVELPYELKKDHGNDLYDYICGDGHTKDDLDKLIAGAKQWTQDDDAQTEPSADGKNTHIVLDNDEVDTFSREFEKWSIDKCGVRHRYNTIDGWSIFHKSKYQRVPHDAEVEKYIRQFIATEVRIKKRLKQEDGSYTHVKIKPDRNHKTRGFIGNIMAWLRDSDSVHLRPGQAAPCSLGGVLDARFIIPLKNGLLDWSTYPYRFLPLNEDFYTFSYLPYEWHGEVDSELWLNYLLDVTNSNIEMCSLLQQWAGYCLMKHNRSQQRFMLIYGESSTGKTVYADVLTHMIGVENVSFVSLEQFDEIHLISDTYGKLLNICDESEEAILDPAIENALKHYTGGTMYQFKKIYKEPFTAYPTAKIMITTNHLPKFKDSSEGVWRRMLMVPFKYIIPEDKRIYGLQDKIMATEMPGVLKWALEGARSLVNGAFVVPDVCKSAVREYKKEMHPEYSFLEENFEPNTLAELSVPCKVLRTCYETWCKTNGFGVKNDKNLGLAVKKLFPNIERIQKRKGAARHWVYDGLTFKVDSEFYDSGVYNAY